MFAVEMRTYIFLLFYLGLMACGNDKKAKEVNVADKTPTMAEKLKPLSAEVSEISLLKEELESDIEEGASIDIVFKERLNDSVNYVISKVQSGDCELIYLTTFLKGKNYLSLEIKKQCPFSKKELVQESKNYSIREAGIITLNEMVKYIPRAKVSTLNDYIDIPDSMFLLDSLVKTLQVNEKGEIDVNLISDYNHYINPSFKSVDHDGDFTKVFMVIVDTGNQYFILNKSMYQLGLSHKIPIDTLGRYYNIDKNKLILPEEDQDEIYAGDYIPRRFEEIGLSIEYLSFYQEHAKEETFVLVAGMYKKKSEANKLLGKLSKKSPNSWILESNIFIGCMH